MATKVLGIELGDRLIKVCETNLGPGARKVSACVLFPTPPNAVYDGEIRAPEAVAAALKENLHKHGIKNKKVIFTVSSGRIAIREVTIPPVRDTRIKTIIEANAADYFPVDMSNYHITYTLQERISTGENAGCRVLVMAAPLTLLDGYFKTAALAGFSVQAIDYSGNSQFRLLEMQHSDGVTMYVDVGGSFSVTTVMKKTKLLMQRTFPSGVDDYVLAFMSATGKNEEDYLAAIRELSTEHFDLNALASSALGEYISRLVANISRMADYYNSSNWEAPIDKLVLTGIGAQVAGLKETVAESAELPVTLCTKLDKVSAPNSLTGELPQFISCLGCPTAPVDFIPESYSKAKKKETKKKKESISLGVTILTVCILGTAALSAYAYLNYDTAAAQKRELEKKIAELAYTEDVRNAYLSYNKYNKDITLLDSATRSPNDGLKTFIEELEQKMPAEITVLSASCAKDGIDMNITVGTKTAAAATVRQLRSFESIKNIIVGQLTDQMTGSADSVSFSVQCQYSYEPVALPKQTPSPKPSAAPKADTASPSGASPSAEQGQ
jgi:type IV pilus assembly protein PilM